MECFDDRTVDTTPFGQPVAVLRGPFPGGLILIPVGPGRHRRGPGGDTDLSAGAADSRGNRKTGVRSAMTTRVASHVRSVSRFAVWFVGEFERRVLASLSVSRFGTEFVSVSSSAT